MDNCICGSGKERQACCHRFIELGELPGHPEELMRSRYVAFATSKVDYLLKTEMLKEANTYEGLLKSCAATNWRGLRVINSNKSGTKGIVQFEARFTRSGNAGILKEKSSFKYIDNQWFYVGGDADWLEAKPSGQKKVKRNDPCPCGSGKKFKKCCI